MAKNQQFDILSYDDLDWSYDRIENELKSTPRFVQGSNCYVTAKGKLARRPGTDQIPNMSFPYRVDRIWEYATEENPQKVYLIFSAFNHNTKLWELYWSRMGPASPTSPNLVTNLRAINESTQPHEGVVARGKFYVKGFPTLSVTENYGCISLDGTSGNIVANLWGIPRPSTPARIDAVVHFLTSSVDSSTTTIPVDSTVGFPATPFVIQIDNEEMNVTSVVGLNLTVTRGFNGTLAAAHASLSAVVYRPWTASTHYTETSLFWRYTYCYESITGQVSSRAPLEANPNNAPSSTGPFINLLPKIIITGTADTTNIPNIRIYRTTDGGGKFFYLDTIPNPGATTVTYIDDNLAQRLGTTGFNDPVSDDVLADETAVQCPTLTSNDPPPPNVAPEVPGTDPVDYSTPLAFYAGRIWYGIGTTLVFSNNEETLDGIPEESFDSGQNGNFYFLQEPITALKSTSDALYITTITNNYLLTGQTLDSFNLRPSFDQVGLPKGNPRAITRYKNTIAQLTGDFRIVLVEGESEPRVMSDKLFTDIVDASNFGAKFQLEYWADLEKEWLFVCAIREDNPIESRQWVLDLRKTREKGEPFWFVPWEMQITCVCSCRISESTAQKRLVVFFWDPITNSGQFSRLDPTGRTTTDYTWDGPTKFSLFFTTHLMLVPTGNHVNAIRREGFVPSVYAIEYDRLTYSTQDTPPFVYYYTDDLWTDPVSTDLQLDPPRREQSTGYATEMYMVNSVAQRFAIRMQKINDSDNFQVLALRIYWLPESGA